MRFSGPTKKTKNNFRGFSLVEVLIVMAFIAIAFLSLLELFVASYYVGNELEGTVEAIGYAQQKIEQVMSQDFFSVTSEAKTQIPGTSYYRQLIVSSESSHLKSVQVNVFWEIKGQEVSYSLPSKITDL